MRIAFYMPFKSLDHPTVSGDRVIGASIRDFLAARGHEVRVISRYRTRWLHRRPWRWPGATLAVRSALAEVDRFRPHLMLTYHSYYKAPDIIGPVVRRRRGVPYALFQGIHSTKHRRDLLDWPGYMAARHALLWADGLFTNKRVDERNLRRIALARRIHYVRPGLIPEVFTFDDTARTRLRSAWQVGDTPVICTAAMFREDVKRESLLLLLRALGRLTREGAQFHLVLAGDGPARADIEAAATREVPGRHTFLGRVERDELAGVYSAADIFCYPGINEGLGMVYLEAQACGRPVVAFDGWGIPEAVDAPATGLLTAVNDEAAYAAAIRELLTDPKRCEAMGKAAALHVRTQHDLRINYTQMAETMEHMALQHT